MYDPAGDFRVALSNLTVKVCHRLKRPLMVLAEISCELFVWCRRRAYTARK